MRRPTIAETALAVLTEVGPLPAAELGRRVAELGATRSKNPTAAVKQALASESRVARLVDGRFALTILALEGLVLTHRLAEEEAEEERVALDPDLSPIAVLAYDGLPLAGGGRAERCAEGHLHGPTGWLGDAAAGELRAFRLRDGLLQVGPVEFADSAVASAQAVLTVIHAELARCAGLPALIGLTLRQAAVATPDLLRDPVAPLGDLLVAVGMVVRGGMAYPPGADPDARPVPLDGMRRLPPRPSPPPYDVPIVPGLADVREALAERVVGRLAEKFGVDANAVDGLALIMQAVDLSNGEPDALAQLDAEEGLLDELGAILAYPGVADLVRLAIAPEPAAAEPLLTQLADVLPPPQSAAAIWLLARLAEARADALTAEALDLRAISADPTFLPGLLDAARAAEDRSDAHTATYYLRRAGGRADHPHLVRLGRYTRLTGRPPFEGRGRRPSEGRDTDLAQDPILDLGADSGAEPGGLGADLGDLRADLSANLSDLDSLTGGRLGRSARFAVPTLPLPVRAPWLLDKALGWSLLPVNRPAVGHLPALLMHPPTGALAQDTILFDRGMLARYLRARAQILPLDEFELARDWLVTERALWCVEAAHPRGHMVLRDVRTGDLAEITDVSGRQLPARGELRYGRVIPDGRDRLLLNGGTPVPEPLCAAFVTLLGHQLDGTAVLAWFEEIYRDPGNSTGPAS